MRIIWRRRADWRRCDRTRNEGDGIITAFHAAPNRRTPAEVAWHDLSCAPLGRDAIAVSGGFEGQTEPDGPSRPATDAAVPRREAGTLKLRIEHEKPLRRAAGTP